MKKIIFKFACASVFMLTIVLCGCSNYGGNAIESVSIIGPDTVTVGETVTFTVAIRPDGVAPRGVDHWSIIGENNVGATLTNGVFKALYAGSVIIQVEVDGVTDEKTINIQEQ